MIEQGLIKLFPRSFTARLLTVAFIGIHIPLIVLATWMVSTSELSTDAIVQHIVVVLVATLVGTGATTWVMYRLLSPLRAAADALDAYYAHRHVPRLVYAGEDEVARVVNGINRNIEDLDKAFQRAQDEARNDALTDVFNRRGCEQALDHSLRMLSKSPEPFTLAVVDMDNLKQINDEFGHVAGDEALVELVNSARQWFGERDWIGRWGGDEFLLGVYADQESATAQFERWISRLADARHNASKREIGVSVGAACWQEDQSSTALYQAADAAMYRAKFSGGGKLEVSQSSEVVSG